MNYPSQNWITSHTTEVLLTNLKYPWQNWSIPHKTEVPLTKLKYLSQRWFKFCKATEDIVPFMVNLLRFVSEYHLSFFKAMLVPKGFRKLQQKGTPVWMSNIWHVNIEASDPAIMIIVQNLNWCIDDWLQWGPSKYYLPQWLIRLLFVATQGLLDQIQQNVSW